MEESYPLQDQQIEKEIVVSKIIIENDIFHKLNFMVWT
jgi:hypothetical protein